MESGEEASGGPSGARKVSVYAVMRHDAYTSTDDPTRLITVKEVLPTWEGAVAEAERLNRLAARKGLKARYYAQATRFYPDGRHVDEAVS